MKGDFSRLTFQPEKHYARVLLQQGRVSLDADWNEQIAILLRRLEDLAADVTGNTPTNCGAPTSAPGFAVSALEVAGDDFIIGAGRYYVDGLCCSCETDTTYLGQSVRPVGKLDTNGVVLVFLDAWEALVVPADDPDLLEPALAGLDTALRTRVSWQIRTQRLPPQPGNALPDLAAIQADWPAFVAGWQPTNRGLLRVRLAGPPTETGRRASPITSAPRFRGPENQLYRVEVHTGGVAGTATFKWSRDNGQMLLPLTSLQGTTATISPGSAERAASLTVGAWVEVSDLAARAAGRTDALVQIKSVDAQLGVIEFVTAPNAAYVFSLGDPPGVALRQWDQLQSPRNHGGGTVGPNGQALVEGNDQTNWLALEDGVEIQFAPGPAGKAQAYVPGDYWLIPARAADDGVLLWPCTGGKPDAKPPAGVEHHFAPLALFKAGDTTVVDIRTVFKPLPDLQDQLDFLGQQISDLAKRVDRIEKK